MRGMDSDIQVSPIKADLAGRLTQAQADTMTASLTRRFTDLVNGTAPFGGPHGGHRP